MPLHNHETKALFVWKTMLKSKAAHKMKSVPNPLKAKHTFFDLHNRKTSDKRMLALNAKSALKVKMR